MWQAAGISRPSAVEALKHTAGNAVAALKAELMRMRLNTEVMDRLVWEYAGFRWVGIRWGWSGSWDTQPVKRWQMYQCHCAVNPQVVTTTYTPYATLVDLFCCTLITATRSNSIFLI